jgi:hypothetical protein
MKPNGRRGARRRGPRYCAVPKPGRPCCCLAMKRRSRSGARSHTPGRDAASNPRSRHVVNLLNWLQVSQRVNAGPLPHSGGQERKTLAVPSEQYVARSGSEYDEMGMIPARFACVLQRRIRYLNMHFLSIFQEVEPISKTCNQLYIRAYRCGTSMLLYSKCPKVGKPCVSRAAEAHTSGVLDVSGEVRPACSTPCSPAIPAASTPAMHGHPENTCASSCLWALRTNHWCFEKPYHEIGLAVWRDIQKCACGRGYRHAADGASFCTLADRVVVQMIHCTNNGGFCSPPG